MKLIQALTITLLTLSFLILTPRAFASTVTEAKETIALLRSATEYATIMGRDAEHERAFLLRNLDAASLSVDQAKFCKAIKNLRDFSERVQRLEREGRIEFRNQHGVTVHDMHEAESMADQIINDLIAQSGVNCSQ